MNFNWAEYWGVSAPARPVLPQCSNFLMFSTFGSREGRFVSVTTLIVAAGRGARATGGDAPPKQYRPIGGVPMIARTIAAFAAHPRIDDILVVIHPDDETLYQAASQPFSGRLRRPIAGGARRQDSVRAGLEALASAAPSSVLIHDAARPFVPAELIDSVIDSLGTYQGALPALPVTDSIKRAEQGRVTGTVERDSLWQAQTPQGFQVRRDPRGSSCRSAGAGPRLHRRFRRCRMVRPRDRAGRRGCEQSQAHHG